MQNSREWINGLRWYHRFVQEIRQRKVGRAATSYALVTWLVLQFADIFLPMVGASQRVMEMIVVFAAGGFPVAIVIAWLFELTPEGIVPDKRVFPTAGTTIANTLLLLVSTAFAYTLAAQFLGSINASQVTNEYSMACPTEQKGPDAGP